MLEIQKQIPLIRHSSHTPSSPPHHPSFLHPVELVKDSAAIRSSFLPIPFRGTEAPEQAVFFHMASAPIFLSRHPQILLFPLLKSQRSDELGSSPCCHLHPHRPKIVASKILVFLPIRERRQSAISTQQLLCLWQNILICSASSDWSKTRSCRNSRVPKSTLSTQFLQDYGGMAM